MKISICMPVMGREKMLAQALHSILLQEHEDYEIIIRDDNPAAPVEKDPKISQLFDFFGSRLHYFPEPHLGKFAAVCNAAIKHSQGDVIYLMGSDDLLFPDALHQVNAVFEANTRGGPLWIYGETISVDEHLHWQGVDGKITNFDALLKQNCIGMPSTFWNREMWNLSGPFDTRYIYASDYEMWLRFWKIHEPQFLQTFLGIYRHHGNQMSVVHREGTEREAHHASIRHTYLGDVISRARGNWNTRRAYDGESMPLSSDELE